MVRGQGIGPREVDYRCKIQTDIAERNDVSAGHIVSKHVIESSQNLISKLKVVAANAAGRRQRKIRRRIHVCQSLKCLSVSRER